MLPVLALSVEYEGICAIFGRFVRSREVGLLHDDERAAAYRETRKQCPAAHSRIDRAGPSFRENSIHISGRQEWAKGERVMWPWQRAMHENKHVEDLLHPVFGTASENDWQGLHREMCAHGRHR